ncbi:MAG: prephenate dehydratase, partial [Phototrophicales bacterium]
MQSNQRVAFQGVEGAYSHLACSKVFKNAHDIACENFQQAIKLVEDDQADCAMIPLENSTAGRVEEIYRLLPNTHLNIIGEHFEPVRHCLLARKGVDIDSIQVALSHPQALAQCFHNLQSRNITPTVTSDTALSAKQLALMDESDPRVKTHAAIASPLAAQLYDLQILIENFQDQVGNTTRFIILSKQARSADYISTQRYLTSILFSVRNIPAALYKALGGFATNGVNLIKLESYMDGGT